jgi:hypothetical protein
MVRAWLASAVLFLFSALNAEALVVDNVFNLNRAVPSTVSGAFDLIGVVGEEYQFNYTFSPIINAASGSVEGTSNNLKIKSATFSDGDRMVSATVTDVRGLLSLANLAGGTLYTATFTGEFLSDSESFSYTSTLVPLPAAVWFMISGLAGLLGFRRYSLRRAHVTAAA